MSTLLELLLRGVLLFGIMCITVGGLLIAGFASDSGPNSFSTLLSFSVLAFALIGSLACVLPKSALFSKSTESKVLWGLLALSVIVPAIGLPLFFIFL